MQLRKFAIRVAFVFVFTCFGSLGWCNDYYVSATNGNDSNPGTVAKPWKTIQHGVDQLNAGDNLLVQNGTYWECVNITKSGTVTNRITIAAAPNHQPIIDGTRVPRTNAVNHGNHDLYGGFLVISQANVTIHGFEIRNFQGVDGVFPSGIWVAGSSKNDDRRQSSEEC